MERTAKISISLPENVLAAAEAGRRATGESRSEFFRRAVETLLDRRREQQAIKRYVAGYRNDPEGDDEVKAATAAAAEVLAREPWDVPLRRSRSPRGASAREEERP